MFIRIYYDFIAWVFTDTHSEKEENIDSHAKFVKTHNITIKFILYINFIVSNYYTGCNVSIHTY